MKGLLTAAGAGALIALLAAPAPLVADEDCDNVVEALEEAIAIATKNLEETVADLQKIMSEPADDKKKTSVKNIACSATGEFLGTARASRAVASVCSPNQRTALAAFDKSIKEMEAKIDGTCR
jgi:hypothetical protein